jgi:O-antigen ligase
VRRFVLLALLLPVAFMVLPSDMRLRIQSSWDRRIDRENGMKGANTSADGRWYGFLAGIEMFRDRPLLGVGIGNFKDYRVAKCDGIYLSAHNLPGELLGELGICGGVTFLLVVLGIWLNWRAVARMARSSLAPDIRGLRLLMLACRDAILMMAYASVTQHTLQRYHWYMIAAFGVLAIKLATPAQYGVGSYFEESEVEGESLVLV